MIKIIVYEEWLDEVTDPQERITAKRLGPLVRTKDGENVRVVTGDIVDGVEYKLAGGFVTEIKREKPIELPTVVERYMQDFLGRAYQFNFRTKNETRKAMKRLLSQHPWNDLRGKLEDMVRVDRMRPLSALNTLLSSPLDTEESHTPAGQMSPDDLKALGL